LIGNTELAHYFVEVSYYQGLHMATLLFRPGAINDKHLLSCIDVSGCLEKRLANIYLII